MASCSRTKDGFPDGIEHVVVIGIDGLSVEGLKNAKTPVLDSLILNGSVCWNARTVLPSVSSPNWASMIMGAGPEQHGIINNEWELDDHAIEPIVSGQDGRFPSIFSILRKQRPQAEIASIYQWDGFGRLYNKESLSFDRTFSTADSTATAAAAYISQKKPHFTFIHLDDVDGAGHGNGHGTQIYLDAVGRIDSLVGMIMNEINRAGISDKTLIMITSDHGGIGYGHGGDSKEEITVPVVLSGKAVKQKYLVTQPVYMYDVAATIAFALQLKIPYSWIGRPVKAAFRGYEEPEGNEDEKILITAPVIYPKRDLYQQAGGLYIGRMAEVSIKEPSEDVTIRFTTDGSEPGPRSAIYEKPFSLEKTSVVKAKAFDASGNESLSTVAYFRILSEEHGNGLSTSFYQGADWKFLPVLKSIQPSSRWVSHEFQIDREQINELITGGNPNFGLVYEGFLEIDRDGEYTFYAHSDDGSKVYLNDEEVVDNDGSHGVRERIGKITLKKGRNPIRVEFFNGGGGYWLDVFYKGPGIAKQIIPADKLFLKSIE
ncbi:alkaline phosphatase family protein [Pontibacter sp. 13R65]|uniref:alkaline phosphatase family protein n=1 Tax=Pontibacter sp. 13R65 TaxID=3127458 RepID=UPI00301BA598